MADSDKVILLKIEVEKAQASANIDKLKASLQDLDGRRKEARVISRKLRLEEAKLADLRNRSSKSISKHANELKNANKQTGAATSATLEFGRVLSDAPYGIRGVANNVQQLASNLFFMGKQVDATTGKTIGFKGAIGSLIKNLAGPAGVLVAFQGVIALFDYFSTSTKKAKEEVKGLTEEFTKLLNKVADLEGKLPDSLAGLLNNLGLSNNEFEDFVAGMSKTIKLLNNEFPEFKNAYDKLSDTQKKDPKVISEIISKYKNLIEVRKQIVEKENTLDLLRDKQGKFAEANLKNNREEYKTLTLKKIALEDIFKKEKKISVAKKGKISPFATPKELEIDIKNAENAIIQYEKQIEDANLKEELNDKLRQASTEEEKKLIREAYQVKRLESQIKSEGDILKLKKTAEEDMVKTKTANHIDDMRKAKELFEYKMELEYKAGKITKSQRDELIKDSETKLKEAETQALSEQTTSLTEIGSKYEPLFVLFEDLSAARMDALFSGFGEDDGEDDKKFTLEDGLKKYMELQSAMTDFLSGEYDRQLTIEQNKTNALNNELNQRLLNEDLSKDERERIQLQIGQNDEKLRKKQEAIEKKRFKLNKAANIATASINTYLAASQILSDPSFKGRPVARFVAMAATITTGLLNVAKIARQKFQSSAGSGGSIGAAAGGNGSGDNTREFNFNLAGSTQSNQLTQSIAGQLSQPIQAYVVSSEITSQQQLDLNIANTATIGG